ncbi:MAG: hypothetical protein FWD66_01465 [Paludibacter sp.]|nr:hypothetical protein [Paludibacter sp.]
MTTYQSAQKAVSKNSTEVFLQLSNLNNIKNFQGKIAESVSIKNLTVSDNEISFEADMAGKISMKIIELQPQKFVRYRIESILKDADLQIDINSPLPNQSNISLMLTADIPMTIKMMIGNKLNHGIDKIAEAIAESISN